MMEIPMIGGMHRAASIGDFIFQCVAAKAPPRVAVSWTAPNGMLKRVVVKLSYPNAFTIKGPNVEMPPLGIETAVSMENQSQVLTSRRHSLTWSHFHWPEETPI